MSDFKAKMHQIRFRLGLRPRPAGGAYSDPQDTLAEFNRPTSKGRRGERWKWSEGRGPLFFLRITPMLSIVSQMQIQIQMVYLVLQH